MLFMLVILLITFITLKIKTPSLPEDNPQDEDSLKTGVWLGIGLFTLTTIYLGLYLIFHSRSSLTLTFFTQSFFHSIVKVGFLSYFVHKTPNLYNFVMNSFQLNVVNPVNEQKNTLRLASFQPTITQKVDVIV